MATRIAGPFLSGSTLTNCIATTGLATINAQTESYIALFFDLGQETQYGFVRLSGLTLFDFAYETEPGQGIQTRPGPYAQIPDVAPVPLPASAGFLAFAAAGLAALRRREAHGAARPLRPPFPPPSDPA